MPGKRILTLCQNWYSEVGNFKLGLKIWLVWSSDYQSFFLPASHLHASHSGIIIRDSCGEAEGRIDTYWGKTLPLWLFGDSDIPVPSTSEKNAQKCIFSLKLIQSYARSCCFPSHIQNSASFWEKWVCREGAERSGAEWRLWRLEWPHSLELWGALGPWAPRNWSGLCR